METMIIIQVEAETIDSMAQVKIYRRQTLCSLSPSKGVPVFTNLRFLHVSTSSTNLIIVGIGLK